MRTMSGGKCEYLCPNKTAFGYCKTTACVNPQYSNIGTAQYGQGVQKAVVTNADSIRGMSDEKLAWFLWQRDIQIVERASKAAGFNYHYNETECIHNIKEWLKSPVEEVDDG